MPAGRFRQHGEELMKRVNPEQSEKMKRFRGTALVLLSAGLLLSACASADLYTLREEAIREYNAGNYESARILFQEALEEGGGEVSEVEFDILRYRAECELRTKRYEEAEKTYAILLELDPSEENEELYYDLEAQFARVKEVSEAFRIMESGDYEKAYEAMSAFADLGGDETGRLAFYNKAVCAEYLGNWEEAKALMKEYLDAFPDDADARKEYAFLKTR